MARSRRRRGSTHRNGYRPRGWETQGRRDRAADPEEAAGAGVLPELPGAAASLGAGDRRGRDGGLRERRLDPEGRPAGRAAGDRRDDEGSGLGALPGVGRAGRRVPPRGRWRVPTRTYGLTPSRSRSATAAASCRRRSSIAYAVHESGVREVLGLDVGEVESGAFWRRVPALAQAARARRCAAGCVRSARGAEGRDRPVLGCPWQRCTVHFTRDMDHALPSRSARARRRSTQGDLQRRGITSRPRSGSRTYSNGSGRGAEGVRRCWRRPRRTCSPSTGSRPSTGPSSAVHESVGAGQPARSDAGPTSSGSSPTTPP